MLTKLGKYDIKRELGKGAMGIVYEGFDPFIERTVAIKTILKSMLDSAEAKDMLSRFRREAQAAGRLTHPNIVSVYEYGEDQDMAFIAMEFIRGKELKKYFEGEERFHIKDVVRLMSQLLDALEYSHSRGVVHRDIKPANIIITEEGQVKVADFGIARIESSQLTQVGTVLGTPTHMSPEQFMGIAADRRSDIYSSGVILYQFLTGERPFTGSVITIMHKVLNQEPVPPSALNFNVSKALDEVVKKAMAKRPEDRFQTAGEFAEALRDAVERGVTAPDETVVSAPDETVVSAPDETVVSATVVMASQPGTAAEINQEELDHWKRLQSSTSIPDLQLYLKKYPDGTFNDLAKSKIVALERNQLERRGANRPQITEAAAEADSSKTEVNFWRRIKASADLKDFEAYLEKYPQGHFAEIAKLRLGSFGKAEPSGKEQERKPGAEARVIPAPFAEKEAPQTPEKEGKKTLWIIAAGVLVIAGTGVAWFTLKPPSAPPPETVAKPAPLSAEAQARADAEKAKQEREKLQQQMADLVKLEQEKLELAKQEREKIEKANLEKEKADKELQDKVKQEQELIAKIREETQREQERAAKAKLEGEKLEKARLEKERLAQEKERLAQEEEKLAKEKLAKEKLTAAQAAANAERIKQEKEKAAREKAIAEKERAAAEKARLELEKAEQARLAKEKALRAEQEQALAKLKAEREAAATRAAEAKAKAEAEKAAAKARAEAEAIAEKKRIIEAETKAKADADATAAKAKADTEKAAKAKADAEAATAKAKADAEAEAKRKAEAEKAKAAAAPAAPSTPAVGDPAALYQQGLNDEDKGNIAAAMKSFQTSANAGYGPAMKKLGDIYGKGNDVVPRDYAASIKWYNKAKQAGIALDANIKH